MTEKEIRCLAMKGRSLIYELCGAFEADNYEAILAETEKTFNDLSDGVRQITGAGRKEGAEITVRIVQDRAALQTFIAQAFVAQAPASAMTA